MVNPFTGTDFCIAVYGGENAFWTERDLWLQYLNWPLEGKRIAHAAVLEMQYPVIVMHVWLLPG